VSYFRPQKATKTGPRSICSLPDSTQNLSRKEGQVTVSRIQLRICLEKRGRSTLQSVPIPAVFQGCSPVLYVPPGTGKTYQALTIRSKSGAISNRL
jgi:hypothetical protein